MRGWSRDTPWRQGHVLSREAVERLGLARPDTPSAIFVVVSHDCDIAQSPDIEPHVELVVGHPVACQDGNYSHAKNPRKLHLQYDVPGGALVVVEMSAADKIRASKDDLAGLQPDRSYSLPWEQLSTLQRWLAARYRRAAFPDAFNERLDTTGLASKLTRILTPLGEYIHSVFFDVDDGIEREHEMPEDPYTLDIYLLYDTSRDPAEAEDLVAEACRKIRAVFRKTLFVEGDGWKIIELRSCEAISDEAMTFKQSTLLKKWNLDYLSHRESSHAEPAE